MSNDHKSTRIGDLLVERGTITRHQLLRALKIQQERQLQPQYDEINANDNKELGEILIELQLINRRQLESGLNWQNKLRRTTFMVAFIAPLLTAACGTGAASATASTREDTLYFSSSFSSLAAPGSSNSTTSTTTASAPGKVIKSSASHTGVVSGPVAVYWCVPTQRENGELLSLGEISGYELRYKERNETDYRVIRIENGFTDAYYFDHLQGEFEFQIATIDNNGVYSEFVPIQQT